MKLTVILLITSLTSLYAAGYAQKVSVNEKNVPLSAILKEIKKQTGYNFLYNTKMMNEANPVHVSFKDLPIEKALQIIFSDQPLTFLINKNNVIVKRKPEQPVVFQELITVVGKVVDENKLGLPGVTVKLKGTVAGVMTSPDGSYSIKVPKDAILVFSYLGYSSQEIRVNGRTTLDISMNVDMQDLEQVVVVGYGTQKRSSISGAVDQVKASQIENRPVSNLTQALQGVSPALVIQQRSMNPNDNTMNINLRGIGTFGNNSPLLVIDGIISEDISHLNNLNPNDVENISILKDAGSAAIYGSRSANGVILVTTKQGKLGMKPLVKFGTIIGSQNPKVLFKPLKGYQNALLHNDSFINVGQNPIFSSEEISQFAQGDSQYGLDALLKNGMQQNHNLSLQGGSTNTSYMVSLGYYDQESNFKGPNYGLKRYNLRSNITTEVGRLKLNTIMWYDRRDGKAFQGSTGFLIADATRVPVYNTYKLKDESGRYYNNDKMNGNPLASLVHGGYTNSNNDHFQGSLNAEFKIIDGLKAKGLVGFDLRPESRLIRRFYWPIYNYLGGDIPVNENSSNSYSIEDYSSKATLFTTQAMLDYTKTFGKRHNVSLLAGYSNESYRRVGFELKRNFVDEVLGIPVEGTIIDQPGSRNSPDDTVERSLYSYFGRVTYDFDNRYYAEGNFRYDGSTKFLKENRWGFFPSVSLGWRVTEERFFDFWKNKVGDLKIRGSYGSLGNQSVDDYQTFTTYKIYQNQYGFNNVAVPGTGYTLGNPGLLWETTTSFNIGADASFLKGKLAATFDYFHKTTKDILLNTERPGTLGGAVPFANLGAMVNQGWELTINYNLNHNRFHHSFGINIGDSWNRVTKYEGNERISKSDEIERIIRVGLPLYSYYGYKTEGLFKNAEDVKNSALPIGILPQPGDIKYKDRNGDGIIDDNDRYVLGHAFPRLTFGFNYTVEWSGFDLNMLWQGVGKRDMALRGELIEPFHGNYSTVMFEHQLDYWTPANPNAKWPRLTPQNNSSTVNNYGKGSDFNIYDAAYLRLKNIQIGYTIPRSLSTKIGMSKLRVFMNGQNLLTFSKSTFVDPESSEFSGNMGAGGANSARNYPLLKYIGGGFNVEF